MTCTKNILNRKPVTTADCSSGVILDPPVGCADATLKDHEGTIIAVIPSGGSIQLAAATVEDQNNVIVAELAPGESYQYSCA